MTAKHTDELRPGAILEARMAAAYRDGRDTARGGERRVNPWDGRAEAAVERVLSVMWANGYSRGNPMSLWGDE